MILVIIDLVFDRIQSESRSRDRVNGDQQKRSLSYGDKLNNGPNNRRQLPSAPTNITTLTTNKNTKLNVDIELEGDHDDLKIREPTPDYDTQSMASFIHPVENSRFEATRKQEDRRNSVDSASSGNGKIKRKSEVSHSTSSNGSSKDISGLRSKQQNNSPKPGRLFDHDEKGKKLFIQFIILITAIHTKFTFLKFNERTTEF